MSHVHTNLSNPYLSDPDLLVEVEGRCFRPVVFVLTRGRSARAHYVFNYLRDDEAVYFVRKTGVNPPVLKRVRAADLASFTAVTWYVGRDARRVFFQNVRKRVADPVRFHPIDEEVRLFSDGVQCYGQYLEPLDVDAATFRLIPKCPASRERVWRVYNSYLAGLGKEELPFEYAARCSAYACDVRHLYRHGSTGDLSALADDAVRAMLVTQTGTGNEDVLRFLEADAVARGFDWVRRARGE